MHAMPLLSLALGLLAADVVVAGLCRPQSSDTSSAVSSTASSISASSTIESLSSTMSYSTTETTSTTESLTLTTSSSSDLSSTSTTFLTTIMSSDSTTVETSTSTPTTTSSTAPYDPIPTFKIVAVGGPVPDAVLRSTGQQGNILTFNPTYSGTRALSFSLEHSTSRVRESNGMYMCLNFGSSLSTVTLCGSESDSIKYLTCTVMSDLTLLCSGPDGHQYSDDEGEQHSYETGATVDYLYVRWEGQGYYTYIGGANVVGGNFVAVKYGLEQVN